MRIQQYHQLKYIILINTINFIGNFMQKVMLPSNDFPHHRGGYSSKERDHCGLLKNLS